jgi:MoxR-like ATPase
LPEAQLDRFLMRLSLGYPSLEEESKMLDRLQHGHPVDELAPVVTAAEMVACQHQVREVFVDENVRRYALEIVHATRAHEALALGGSPRASIALFRSGQALAAMQNRDFVLPDDIKRVALPVLGHRLILKPESRLRKVTTNAIIKDILGDVAVPTLKGRGAPTEDLFSR